MLALFGQYRRPRASSENLAADLGIDEGDVRTLLRQLGEQTPEVPDELAGWLRQMFDSHGELTAPAGLYWPGADDEPCQAYGSAVRPHRDPGYQDD